MASLGTELKVVVTLDDSAKTLLEALHNRDEQLELAELRGKVGRLEVDIGEHRKANAGLLRDLSTERTEARNLQRKLEAAEDAGEKNALRIGAELRAENARLEASLAREQKRGDELGHALEACESRGRRALKAQLNSPPIGVYMPNQPVIQHPPGGPRINVKIGEPKVCGKLEPRLGRHCNDRVGHESEHCYDSPVLGAPPSLLPLGRWQHECDGVVSHVDVCTPTGETVTERRPTVLTLLDSHPECPDCREKRPE